MEISITELREDLTAFRTVFAADLDAMTGTGRQRCERAAAQEGLQLVWSFVVSGIAPDEELGPERIAVLRAVFPDEMFAPDPDGKFEQLRGNVTNAYADQWKYLPSDHLCTLIQGCVTQGDPEPVARYRELAVITATTTCGLTGPFDARKVFDLAKFDAMLKHVRVLTEVGISEATLPLPEQIKAFYLKAGPEHSLSFAFLGGTEPDLARRMVAAFAAQHGDEVTREILEAAVTETVDVPRRAVLETLRESLAGG